MVHARDIERLVSRYRVEADSASRRRILGDAMAVIERSAAACGTDRMRMLLGPAMPAHLLRTVGIVALVTVGVMVAQYLLFLLQLRLEYAYVF